MGDVLNCPILSTPKVGKQEITTSATLVLTLNPLETAQVSAGCRDTSGEVLVGAVGNVVCARDPEGTVG